MENEWRSLTAICTRMFAACLRKSRTICFRAIRTLPGIGLDRLPRMADFALWAAACETALWPAGTFGRAYEAITADADWRKVEPHDLARLGEPGILSPKSAPPPARTSTSSGQRRQ